MSLRRWEKDFLTLTQTFNETIPKKVNSTLAVSSFCNVIRKWDVIQELLNRQRFVEMPLCQEWNDIQRDLIICSNASGRLVSAFFESIPFTTNSIDDNLFNGSPLLFPELPHSLLNPPPNIPYDAYEFNSVRKIIMPVSKQFVYLPNFNVHALDTKEKASIDDDATKKERVLYGLRRMYLDCVKLRGIGITQSLFVSLLSYSCSSCVNERLKSKNEHQFCSTKKHEHICILHSSCVYVLSRIFRHFHDFPFFITSRGVMANVNLQKVSTQFPFIFMQLMELMIAVTDGTLDSVVELFVVRSVLSRSTVSILSETFLRRGAYEKLRKVILSRTALTRFLIKDMELSGVERNMTFKPLTLSEKEEKTIILDGCGEFLTRVLAMKQFSDEFGRKMAVMVNFFHTYMIFVTGSTALSIEQSGKAEPGVSQIISRPRVVYCLDDGIQVPVSHTYNHPYLNALQQELAMLASQVEIPKNKNWEESFFSMQTTNSAGNTDETLAELKKDMSNVEGVTPDSVIIRIRNARVLDTAHKIHTVFKQEALFLRDMLEPKKAGKRLQVARRPRFIQMVGTSAQLPGYIIHAVARPAYKQTAFSVSGKNTNDIRDMNNVLTASSRLGYKGSNDVRAMDAATKKPQVDLVIGACFIALHESQIGAPNMFLGSHQGQRNVRRVQRLEYMQDGSVSSSWCEITMPQYLLLLGSATQSAQTIFPDGHFQKYVHTSEFAFRSGWFPTADQHTFLGCATLNLLQKDLKSGVLYGEHDDRFRFFSPNIKIEGGVLGDDLFIMSKLVGCTNQDDIDLITVGVIRELQIRLEILGYECDPSMSEFECELLKQIGVCGAPELYPCRLVLFSSERGEGYELNGIGRVKIMHAMIQEKISRARFPEGLVKVMWIVEMIGACDIITLRHEQLVVSRRTKAHDVDRSAKGLIARIFKNDAVNDLFVLLRWESKGYTYLLLAPRGLWAQHPKYGFPFPSVKTMRGEVMLGTSCYTIPSNAMTYFWLQMFELPDDLIQLNRYKAIMDMELDKFQRRKLERIKQKLAELGVDSSVLTNVPEHMLLQWGDLVSFDISVNHELELMMRAGFYCGHILEKICPDLTIERLRSHEALLISWKASANMLLDGARVEASEFATYQLRSRYGVNVPDSIVYSNRAGAKIDQVLQEVKKTNLEYLRESVSLLQTLSKLSIGVNHIMRELRMGCFRVVNSTCHVAGLGPSGVIENGFGHSVPPQSLQSFMIEAMGFPKVSGYSRSAIVEASFVDRKIPGDPSLYAKMYREAERRGPNALIHLRNALGFSKKDMQSLQSIVQHDIIGIDLVHFALNPRHIFYFNTGHDVKKGFFVIKSTSRVLTKYLESMGIALALMRPTCFLSNTKKMISAESSLSALFAG